MTGLFLSTCTDADNRANLSMAEGTLLWSMRTWVIGLARPDVDVSARIEAAFADLRAPGATPFLDGFMWALRHGAVRTIGVDCPCQARVDPDERALLDVFALAQNGNGMEAVLLLRGMVTPAAARTALASAERVAERLAQAGTRLTNPVRPGLAMFALSAGSARLH